MGLLFGVRLRCGVRCRAQGLGCYCSFKGIYKGSSKGSYKGSIVSIAFRKLGVPYFGPF